MRRSSSSFVETLKTIFFAVLIALGIRTIAFEPFNIPSGSMIPTLLIGDYLFVSKFSYGYSTYSLPYSIKLFSGRILFNEPQRGDVAVFKLPRDNKTDYIKRIIGLPGDRIQMKEGGLLINGQPVKRERIENYSMVDAGMPAQSVQYIETLPNGRAHRILELQGDNGSYDNTREFEVPPGNYFMMGDNRDNSLDSRVSARDGGVGFVPAENLVGRAEFLFFSTDGSSSLLEPWKWAWSTRYDRIFQGIW